MTAMPAHPTTCLRIASLAIASLVLPGVLHGCSAPTAPPPPPGGGSQITLGFEEFEQSVSPVLERHGCDATGDCHGGGIRGSLELSPPGSKDLRFDFDQIALQVSAAAPEQSPVLTEPLAVAAGGTPHSFKAFDSTGDADYQAIQALIRDGVTP
jgi:hypothetical protein